MNKENRKRFIKEIHQRCKVDGSSPFILKDHQSCWSEEEGIRDLSEDKLKKKAKKIIDQNLDELAEQQELLYASDSHAMLLIFQAMDAAGKDGTIKHVMSGINPQGCQVFSFKQPSSEELDHTYLWRYNKRMPERGRIGIFNRSYYEEVLVVKVNPGLLENAKLTVKPNGSFWNQRYEDIRNLEKHLCTNGTIVRKFFLNVSKEEQKNRFMERLNNPEKHWKFSEADLRERAKWDIYMKAFEEAINQTATPWAPWYVVPADNKWIMRTIVSMVITDTIRSLKLKAPELTQEKMKQIKEAKKQLSQK